MFCNKIKWLSLEFILCVIYRSTVINCQFDFDAILNGKLRAIKNETDGRKTLHKLNRTRKKDGKQNRKS